jgi:hypothetical protein
MYSGSVVILPLPLNIFLIIEVVLRNASEDRGMKEFTDSTKPKKKGSNPIEEVRIDLVGLELEALSTMLHHWATPEIVVERKDEWEDKIPAFRSAVIKQTGTGSRMKIEPEIIRAEFESLKVAIEYVQSEKQSGKLKSSNDLITLRIPCLINGTFKMFRPFPVPIDNLKKVWSELLDRTVDYDVVVREIIHQRLGAGDRTIRESLKNPCDERFKLSEAQKLFVSIFLDICSDLESRNKWDGLKAKILYTLYYSEPQFKVILIYYLVQTAHRLEKKIFVGEYEPKLVNDLCEKVCPKIEKINYQPFIRLVSAE